MDNASIEKEMYRRATELICTRYPTGWGGAAVVHTEDDRYFTSVWMDTINSSVTVCIELGAMCQAHQEDVRVTHCLCVVRSSETGPFRILTPCGVCQERLRFWGSDVRVGVSTANNSLRFVALSKLQPYHWTNAYPQEAIKDYAHFHGPRQDAKESG